MENIRNFINRHKILVSYLAIQIAIGIFVIISFFTYLPKVNESILTSSSFSNDINLIKKTSGDIYNVLTKLAVNDSIMNVQLRHFPTSPPISLREMTAVSSVYSGRIDPITNEKEFHCGVDYRAAKGTDVRAAADGVVIKAGWNDGYGNTVDVDHLNGYTTRYAHLDRTFVHKDEFVYKGETIGKVGNTGQSTGAHLHFEIAYLADKINPTVFVPLY